MPQLKETQVVAFVYNGKPRFGTIEKIRNGVATVKLASEPGYKSFTIANMSAVQII